MAVLGTDCTRMFNSPVSRNVTLNEQETPAPQLVFRLSINGCNINIVFLSLIYTGLWIVFWGKH